MLKIQAHKMLNRIVALIREKQEVSFAIVCYECEIAPPTLYNYIGLIEELFPDIKYKNKKFWLE